MTDVGYVAVGAAAILGRFGRRKSSSWVANLPGEIIAATTKRQKMLGKEQSGARPAGLKPGGVNFRVDPGG